MIGNKNILEKSGFTIVELILCIVVIGILAGISLVGYKSVQDRARTAMLHSDLTSAAEVLNVDKVRDGSYPQSPADADRGRGLPASGETTYQYNVDNSAEPKTFCLTGTNNSITYYITESSSPIEGACP